MKKNITTVDEYLESLPDDKRCAIERMRKIILAHLPQGYQEAFNWGMISYQVPLSVYPHTYNGQPLMYAALSAGKSTMSLYLMGVYISEKEKNDFEQKFRETGKRLNAGKSCVRFKNPDDLPLELIQEYIAKISVSTFIAMIEGALKKR
jgi:hypothetical protein